MLGKNTRRATVSTYSAMLRQGMSADDMIAVLVPVLYLAGTEAQALARAELARVLARMTGEPVGTFLVASDTPLLARERIEQALLTTLADADGDSRLTRLQRMSYADPLAIGQQSLQAGMQDTEQVEAYVRVLDSDACELCVWLHKDGFAYPKGQPMHQHPGCVCSARPVLKTVPLSEDD